MSYRPFKKQVKKVDLAKLEDYDLYFEEVPPATLYKLQRTFSRNMRKLKVAQPNPKSIEDTW